MGFKRVSRKDVQGYIEQVNRAHGVRFGLTAAAGRCWIVAYEGQNGGQRSISPVGTAGEALTWIQAWQTGWQHKEQQERKRKPVLKA